MANLRLFILANIILASTNPISQPTLHGEYYPGEQHPGEQHLGEHYFGEQQLGEHYLTANTLANTHRGPFHGVLRTLMLGGGEIFTLWSDFILATIGVDIKGNFHWFKETKAYYYLSDDLVLTILSFFVWWMRGMALNKARSEAKKNKKECEVLKERGLKMDFLQEHYMKLVEKNKKMEVALEKAKKKNEKTEAALEEEKKRNETLEKENRDLKNLKDDHVEVVIPSLEKELDTARLSLGEKIKELADTKVELKKAKKELKEMLRAATKKIRGLKGFLGSVEEELESTKTKLGETKEALDGTVSAIKTMTNLRMSEKLLKWEGDLSDMKKTLGEMNSREGIRGGRGGRVRRRL